MEKSTYLMEEKGTTTLEDLDLTGLSKKQQKQAALEFFLEVQKQLCTLDIESEKKKRDAKMINEKLKLTDPVRKLAQLKKEVKQNERTQNELRSRYIGALGLLAKLGINITKELRNIKLIEGGEDGE
jgi:hypothetical protein